MEEREREERGKEKRPVGKTADDDDDSLTVTHCQALLLNSHPVSANVTHGSSAAGPAMTPPMYHLIPAVSTSSCK